jgi:hypothetical protein
VNKSVKPVIVGFIVTFVTAALLGFIGSLGGVDPGFTPALVGMIFGAFTWYIMANLAGNLKAKAATPEAKAAAVALRPEPGKAMLIVFREGFVGKAAGLNVIVDGQPRAQLKSPRFTAIPLDPGSHEMETAFGALAGKQNCASHETFTVVAGDVVIFTAKVSMGALKNTISVERITPNQTISDRLSDMIMIAPLDAA